MSRQNAIRALAAATAVVVVVACGKDMPTTPATPSPAVASAVPAVAVHQANAASALSTESQSPEYCLVNTPLEADDDALASADPQARQELATLRATVAHMRDGAGAIANGYFPNPLSGCLQGAGDRGGLGRNFTNQPYAFDSVLDPSMPEIVVMEDQPDGSTKLVSVLHTIGAGPGYTPIRAESFSGPPYPSRRPKLYGRYFDGPLVQPGVGFVFWALRVHVGRRNPKGMFHPYSPGISCEYSSPTLTLDPLPCWFPD